jgi:hypothetical protein
MTRDCRSIGTNKGEVSDLRNAVNIEIRAANLFGAPDSRFCVHLSQHEFVDDVGGAQPQTRKGLPWTRGGRGGQHLILNAEPAAAAPAFS